MKECSNGVWMQPPRLSFLGYVMIQEQFPCRAVLQLHHARLGRSQLSQNLSQTRVKHGELPRGAPRRRKPRIWYTWSTSTSLMTRVGLCCCIAEVEGGGRTGGRRAMAAGRDPCGRHTPGTGLPGPSILHLLQRLQGLVPAQPSAPTHARVHHHHSSACTHLPCPRPFPSPHAPSLSCGWDSIRAHKGWSVGVAV